MFLHVKHRFSKRLIDRKVVVEEKASLCDRHGLQILQHTNILNNVAKKLMQLFQNLCFTCRNMQTKLLKLDLFTQKNATVCLIFECFKLETMERKVVHSQ